MKQYTIGIIGYGGMAVYHQERLIRDPRLRLAGVSDIDPARCDLARAHGLRVYDSNEALLADPGVDLVLVATPNHFHHDLSVAALEAGKHVVCEKPVAMDSAELLSMMDCARRTGRVLTIHQNRRRDADFILVRDALRSGRLGRPFSIESRVLGSRGVPFGWRCHKLAGGGMMLDWGVHLVDQVLQMIPEPVVSVYAQLFSIHTPEVDDAFKLFLRFESGVTALVEVGTLHYLSLPRWFVCGDRGTLQVDDWSCRNRLVRPRDEAVTWEEEILFTKAGPTKTMAPRSSASLEEETLEAGDVDFAQFYTDLLDHLEGKAPLAVTPDEALRVMQVMEAAFRSQETGQAIPDRI